MNFYNFIIILFLKIRKNSARDVTDVIHVPRSHRSRFINLGKQKKFLVKNLLKNSSSARAFLFFILLLYQ